MEMRTSQPVQNKEEDAEEATPGRLQYSRLALTSSKTWTFYDEALEPKQMLEEGAVGALREIKKQRSQAGQKFRCISETLHWVCLSPASPAHPCPQTAGPTLLPLPSVRVARRKAPVAICLHSLNTESPPFTVNPLVCSACVSRAHHIPPLCF